MKAYIELGNHVLNTGNYRGDRYCDPDGISEPANSSMWLFCSRSITISLFWIPDYWNPK